MWQAVVVGVQDGQVSQFGERDGVLDVFVDQPSVPVSLDGVCRV